MAVSWTAVWTSLPKCVFQANLFKVRYRAYNTGEDVVLVLVEKGQPHHHFALF